MDQYSQQLVEFSPHTLQQYVEGLFEIYKKLKHTMIYLSYIRTIRKLEKLNVHLMLK